MFKMFDLERLQKINIQEVGTNFVVCVDNVKEEYREDFGIDEDMLNEEGYININCSSEEIGDYLIDEYKYDYDDFDEYEFQSFIEELIKNTEHYLVVAYSHNWRGQTGYKFVHSLKDCFIRDYDCSQYVIGGSKGQKVLSIREHHHDNPMGSEIVIVALTNTEYEKLDNCGIDEIIEFGNKMREKVCYIEDELAKGEK